MGDASEASKKKIWQMYSSVLAAYSSNQSKKNGGVLPTIEYSEGLAKPCSATQMQDKLQQNCLPLLRDNQQVQETISSVMQ
jgi:hypothetical protein